MCESDHIRKRNRLCWQLPVKLARNATIVSMETLKLPENCRVYCKIDFNQTEIPDWHVFRLALLALGANAPDQSFT